MVCILICKGMNFFLTNWIKRIFADACFFIVSSVRALRVFWVTFDIIISFIFSVSFVGSFLLLGLSLTRPEAESTPESSESY